MVIFPVTTIFRPVMLIPPVPVAFTLPARFRLLAVRVIMPPLA